MGHVRETVVIIVLLDLRGADGVVRQSSKWSGEMSIAFSQASSAPIEAAGRRYRQCRPPGRLSIWGVYVQARAQGDTALATYVESASPLTSRRPTERGLLRGNRRPVRSR